MPLRLVDVQQSILRKNTTLALELRRRFEQSGTFVLNALSSPGSGKTTLVEETLKRLRPRYRVGALVGDQATENDAQRLARSGAAVRQISTGAECRLDAQMVTAAYDELLHCHREVSRRAPEGASVGEDRMSSRPDNDPELVEGERHFDFLAIENVGNLICPAEYDLGEDLRVVLFSVTEGEDKPLKYPLAFTTAHAAIISKIDLAAATDFDRHSALKNINTVHPDLPVMELSVKTGEGVDRWIEFLETRIAQKPVPVS